MYDVLRFSILKFNNNMSRYKITILLVILFLPLYTAYAANKNIDTLGIIFECDTILHKAEVHKLYSKSSHISVPQFVRDEKGESYEVISLGYGAFRDSSINRLTITLPHSISRIGSGAFHDYKNLQFLSIRDSVTYISDRAFMNCFALEQLNIKSVSIVGKYAFAGCKLLKDLSFLNSVKEIEDYAFYGCASIESLYMPDCLYEIGRYAFVNCINLKSIRFSKSIHIIWNKSFKNCSGLYELYFPENIKRICSSAFVGCSNLKVVKVSKNTVIESGAFPENTIIEYY